MELRSLIGVALAFVAGSVLILAGLVAGLVALFTDGRAQGEGGPSRRGRPLFGALLCVVLGGGLVAFAVHCGSGPVVARFHRLSDGLTKQQLSLHFTTSLFRMQSAREIREILALQRYKEPKRLLAHEFKVFSQNGEDGLIAEIFRRIGTTNRHFAEFGAADGMQNNSALLVRQGWGGLWIEGDHELVERARAHYRPEIDAGSLTITEAFITAENIEDLFRQAKVPEELDLLSVDIDRNDYHVWEKITHFRPRVAIIEYNATYPPSMSWVIPYDPKAWWDGTTRAGASLKALQELGDKKGYCLVGCNLNGVNAFFVRKDLVGDHFAAPYTAENHYEPSRFMDPYGPPFPRVP